MTPNKTINRTPYKQGVIGSNPIVPTLLEKRYKENPVTLFLLISPDMRYYSAMIRAIARGDH